MCIRDRSDYSLIDCGGQEKLERFGAYILRRPEPQAIWAKPVSYTHLDVYKRQEHEVFVFHDTVFMIQ